MEMKHQHLGINYIKLADRPAIVLYSLFFKTHLVNLSIGEIFGSINPKFLQPWTEIMCHSCDAAQYNVTTKRQDVKSNIKLFTRDSSTRLTHHRVRTGN